MKPIKIMIKKVEDKDCPCCDVGKMFWSYAKIGNTKYKYLYCLKCNTRIPNKHAYENLINDYNTAREVEELLEAYANKD